MIPTQSVINCLRESLAKREQSTAHNQLIKDGYSEGIQYAVYSLTYCQNEADRVLWEAFYKEITSKQPA